MHRSVPALAAFLAIGSMLASAGPAAADGVLAPGDTQTILLQVPEKWSAALQVDVTVGKLTQQENGCLDPERKAGDDCLPDAGDLAGQVTGTVTLGVPDGSTCVRGRSGELDLFGTMTARLTAPRPGVQCLFIDLTFRNDALNNRAQSDTLTLDLDVVARDFLAGEPGDGSTDSGGQVDGRTPSDLPTRDGSAPDGDDAATDSRASGQDADGTATTSRDVSGQEGNADSGALPAVPADPAAIAVDQVEDGPVLDRLEAQVSVGDDGVEVQTASAQSSPRGEMVAWASLLLGSVALGWSAFVLVMRRRRKKVTA